MDDGDYLDAIDGHPIGIPEQHLIGIGPANSDPVSLGTGDYQLIQSDLQLPGRGLRFDLRRTYRSLSGVHSRVREIIPKMMQPLGANWDHSYNIRMFVGLPGASSVPYNAQLWLLFGEGRFDSVDYNPTLGAHVIAEHRSIVRYNASTRRAELITADGAVYRFAPFAASPPHEGGELESITDRNGNQISFEWDTVGSVTRLASVTDTLGHVVQFEYHDDTASPLADSSLSHLVWRVTDDAGRAVEYLYDIVTRVDSSVKEKLIQVILPAIDTTTEFPLPTAHARFTAGRELNFEYAAESTNPDIWWGGQLTKMWSPNGDLVLQNEYEAPSTSQTLTEQRVSRQVFGDGTFNYKVTDRFGDDDPIVAEGGVSEDYSVWVNNREGHIIRFDYAGGGGSIPAGRLVRKVQYVGTAADLDAPSWATLDEYGEVVSWTNGPGTPIRAEDTDQVTEQAHDSQWNLTERLFPNGDRIVLERLLESQPSADPRRASVVTSRRTQSFDESFEIEERWEQAFEFPSGEKSNRTTAHIDGRGYVTLYRYDTYGNLRAVYHKLPPSTSTSISDTTAASLAAAIDEYTRNEWGQVVTHTHPAKAIPGPDDTVVMHSRVDRYEYGTTAATPSYGRITAIIIDDGETELRTEFEYNAIGNCIKVIEPDGGTTTAVFNQDTQPVRIQRWDSDPDAPSSAAVLMAQTDNYYDANGNLVRVDELNLDGDLAPVTANTAWSTVMSHNALNRVVAVANEVSAVNLSLTPLSDGSGRFAIPSGTAWSNSEIEYNLNGKITEIRLPEAVDERQTSNKVTYEYDELDRVYRRVDADDLLVTQYDYDLKGRRNRMTVSPDDSNHRRITTAEYDPADRVVLVTDPMGNERHLTWTDTGEMESVAVVGQLLDGSTDNSGAKLLAYAEFEYDGLGRRISQSTGWFLPGELDANEIPEAFSTTEVEYNPNSSIRRTITPVGPYPNVTASESVTEFLYDTASRLVLVTDAAGNERALSYDAGSNLSGIDLTELTDTGSEVYHTSIAYDGLDRAVGGVNGSESGGVAVEWARQFDSRGHLVGEVDPRGNVQSFTIDGLGRVISTSRAMTVTGEGGGSPATNAAITTTSEYDDSSRLTALVDDTGGRTEYEYDGAGRLVLTRMPDGTEATTEWNAAGNAAVITDARGVVVENVFDLNDRLTARDIDLTGASSVGGPTAETYEYDGAGRLVLAKDTSTRTTRAYDSRSLMIAEAQNADPSHTFPTGSDRVVSYEFDAAGNRWLMTHPSSREIYQTFDVMNRLDGIYADDEWTDLIAEYAYVGANRVARRTYGNGVSAHRRFTGFEGSSSEPYVWTGDKGFGSLAELEHSVDATSEVIDLIGLARDAAGNKSRYADTRSGFVERRERSLSYDSADRLVSTDLTFPDTSATGSDCTTDYELDGDANRISVSSTLTPGSDGTDASGSVVGTYAQAGANAANNQYTTSPVRVYTYDANGNMAVRAELQGADFDNNYSISSQDMYDFLAAYFAQQGQSYPTAPPGSLTADFNGSGGVTSQDLFDFLGSFMPSNGQHRENDRFTYDYRNRLIQFERREGSTLGTRVTYVYDALDRLAVEIVETDTNADGTLDTSATTQNVYGGRLAWQAIEQFNGVTSSATVTASHVYGDSLDELLRSDRDLDSDTDFDAVYFHHDERCSIRAATDAGGEVLERYEYGDFGLPHILEPDGVTVRSTSAIGNRVLYAGRPWIPEIGLYDSRYRFLDPRTGRFVQRDPIGYADGMNLYGYVGHDPFSATDPLGLTPQWLKEAGSWITEGVGGLLGFHGSEVAGAGWTLDNIATGGAATIDGLIPFYDPMDEHVYDYDECDPINRASRFCGEVSREAALFAAGGVFFRGGAAAARSAGGAAKTAAPRNWSAYEALYEAPIRGTTRAAHRASANSHLASQLKGNADLAGMMNQQLGGNVVQHMQSGRRLLNPPGTVWHHPANNPNVMHLLRTGEHTAPALQPILHPRGVGGFGTFYGP